MKLIKRLAASVMLAAALAFGTPNVAPAQDILIVPCELWVYDHTEVDVYFDGETGEIIDIEVWDVYDVYEGWCIFSVQ